MFRFSFINLMTFGNVVLKMSLFRILVAMTSKHRLKIYSKESATSRLTCDKWHL